MALVIKSDTPELHLVFGEVYSPDRPDSQGEFMRADEIRKMAHDFSRRLMQKSIDNMHDNKVDEDLNHCIVETFIARKGDPDFIEGSWVIGMHIPDEGTWEKIKKGEINGFSMEAMVVRHDFTGEADVPESITGVTSKSEDHTHTFNVKYDKMGIFQGGQTSVDQGHSHEIVAGTHTEIANAHSHRFSSVDSLSVL
jgi:hypothetical protein